MDIELVKDIAKRIRESSVREVAHGIDNDVVAKTIEDLIELSREAAWSAFEDGYKRGCGAEKIIVDKLKN